MSAAKGLSEPPISPETARALSLIRMQVWFLDDLERVRVGSGNRCWALKTRLGYTDDEVPVQHAMLATDGLKSIERIVKRDVAQAFALLPWHSWVEENAGIGDIGIGRIIGIVGHPRWRMDQETELWFPRTVGQLWSYAGYAPVDGRAVSMKHGEKTTFNTNLRMACFRTVDSALKQRCEACRKAAAKRKLTDPDDNGWCKPPRSCSCAQEFPYRALFDEARVKYAKATHGSECVRCGPKGKPALAGSDLSDGHKHARALRLVAKAMLKDLWIAASEDFGEDGATIRPNPMLDAPRSAEEQRMAA